MDYTKLVNELKKAAEAYYRGESPLMTDEVYDAKLAQLKKHKEENNIDDPEINALLDGKVAGGSLDNASYDDEVTHTIPMLSLKKADSEDELKSYFTKTTANEAKGHKVQAKLDGLALAIKYKRSVASMATRGDGTTGESLIHLNQHKELSIKHLPSFLDTDKEVEIRGELFADDAQFQEMNKARMEATNTEFKNSRNAVVGVVKGSKSGLGYNTEISFVVYSIMIDGVYTDPSEVKGLPIYKDLLFVDDYTDQGYKNAGGTLSVTTNDIDELSELVADFGEKRPNLGFPTDGIVIKPQNEAELYYEMGANDHHPIAFIAYKYQGVSGISIIEDIIVNVGRTGKLTPVAKITPVEVDGTVISNVTLHNYSWMAEMGVGIGAEVEVARANDVIPAIRNVLTPGESTPIAPKSCPVCDATLVEEVEEEENEIDSEPMKTIRCMNKSCKSRMSFALSYAVGRGALDIDGLSSSTLKHLQDSGEVTSIADLFALTKESLAKSVSGVTKTGSTILLGEKRAEKIFNAIEKSKTNTDAFKIMAFLGIDSLGQTISKDLLSKFETIEDCLALSYDQLLELEGWGDIRAKTFVEQADHALENLKKMKENGLVPKYTKKSSENKGSFAISGKVPSGYKNRGEYVVAMENLGWVFHSSPKKDTNYVIGDPNGSSDKIIKAKKLGLKIVSDLPQ